MKINNSIEACNDGRERLMDLERRVVAVVHRTETGHDAAEIALTYKTSPKAGPVTGYQMPYTFVIHPDGYVEQALKLADYGPHARAWNSRGIGVACIGDFRRRDMPEDQYQSLVWLLARLAQWLDGVESIYGHDELRDAMSDRLKECPGQGLNMDQLRADVRLEVTECLTNAGVVL